MHMQRFSILVDPITVKRVKLLAIDERVSASKIMRDALEQHLKRESAAQDHEGKAVENG